ncbi:MAG TPA: beta-galactosidase [Bacillota bacterium]|mgnify:FL=1|nr:beta-galactosidase [Bacillota bacterium]HOK67995.1 beta-galactosidase [Bacillota bacterium]HPP84541.1 beta-galactosidase [Bacillota bacterium]
MSIFYCQDGKFYLDGEEFTILSGAIHYFRVHPDYWRDRLLKLKACGFNTVETYICWNLHERKEGTFDFSGRLDLVRFIKEATELGLKIILRPGPYICAEFDFGGLPSWLMGYPHMKIRNNNPLFLSKLEKYLVQVFDRIRPYLCTNGGNIIMLQVENEYGSYGDDKEYLKAVADIYRRNGMDVLLFTSDGGNDLMFRSGSIDGLLSAANFGSDPERNFAPIRKYRPGQPLFCAEYWNGWFDHWYDKHHTRSGEDAAKTLDDILSMGASVNFYMLHGGTNFGFTNGANCMDRYEPTVTSYDYDAPISECGDLTEKYFKVKKVIEKHTGKKIDIPVENTPKAAYGKVLLNEYVLLFDVLPEPKRSPAVLTMEETGQDFGYILYSTEIAGAYDNLPLILEEVHDRAHIFINGELKGIVERSRRNDPVYLNLKEGEKARLDILVENMGRVNYGPYMFDKKGILGGVRFGQMYHFGWDIYNLTLDTLPDKYASTPAKAPLFLRGYFDVDNVADTFLYLDHFTKGAAFVNGFNLGRYYTPAGPQKSLYVPAPLLKKGRNEIVVFETDGYTANYVEFKDTPDLG